MEPLGSGSWSDDCWAKDTFTWPHHSSISFPTTPPSSNKKAGPLDGNLSSQDEVLSPALLQEIAQFSNDMPLFVPPQTGDLGSVPPPAAGFVTHTSEQVLTSSNSVGSLPAARSFPTTAIETETTNQQGRRKRRRRTRSTSADPPPTSSGGSEFLQPPQNYSITDEQRELARLWLNLPRFQSRHGKFQDPSLELIERFADCIDVKVGTLAEYITKERPTEARLSPPLTPTPMMPMNSSKSTSTATAAALKSYCEQATQRSCDTLQRRKRNLRGPFQCTSKSCNYRTNLRESWQRHMDLRQPRKIYVCADCQTAGLPLPFTEHRVDKFRDHVKKAHKRSQSDIADVEERSSYPQKPDGFLHCGFCSQRFAKYQKWRDHLLQHYDRGKANSEEWNVGVDWRADSLGHEIEMAGGNTNVDHNSRKDALDDCS
ncbi:hypothetical protein EV356DRAFT_537472 [Viridothelium virens]|uniref:C2H2-type domain-containing protein n=1 Tax=Viridothelium virens TaxID=1048519 RepID=A0A6A6GV26_VIRVR|nr:hypothetical protein EV356DRAFT_537472 [Viridothelium virens]